MPTHLWVVGHLPKVVRDLVFEIGISNVSITLGCAGWALCTSILLSDALDEKSGALASSLGCQGVLCCCFETVVSRFDLGLEGRRLRWWLCGRRVCKRRRPSHELGSGRNVCRRDVDCERVVFGGGGRSEESAAGGKIAGVPSPADEKLEGSQEGGLKGQEGVAAAPSLGSKIVKRLLAIWGLYFSAGLDF